MKKIVFIVIIFAILVAGGLFISDNNQITDNISEDKLSVAATFFPLAEMARGVGEDLVVVNDLTPIGGDPHSYSPTAREVANLQSVDIFLYSGADLDVWAEGVALDLEKSSVKVIEAAQVIDLLEHDEDDHDHEEDSDHEHGAFDPHFWLDPVRMQVLVEELYKTYSEIDSANKDIYRSNANDLQLRLVALHEDYVSGLGSCELDTIIVAHDAFGYLSNRYGFEIESIAGLSPEAQPSARRFAEISDFAKEHNVSVIYFETLSSPELSETLANDLGISTKVLNPLEGLTQEEMDLGANYFRVMEQNLVNLKEGLNC